MRRLGLFMFAILALVGAGCSYPPAQIIPTPLTSMKLTSSVFQENQTIPVVYTCEGQNISPPLAISEAPTGTKSFALTLEDPDTAMGTFDHWVQFNIPAGTTAIPEGQMPGSAGTNGAGKVGYIGPCPPTGTHHYIFKLYALDTSLDLPSTAKKADLLKVLDGHVLGETELVGVYQKQK